MFVVAVGAVGAAAAAEADLALGEVAFELFPLCGGRATVFLAGPRESSLADPGAVVADHVLGIDRRDIAEAGEWMEAFRAAGVEGLVVKGASSRYVAGRGWVKYKTRETVEVIAGGVIGPLKQPEVLIAGRYRGSELVQVGRTVLLSPEQSAALGAVLRKAMREHPGPDEIGTGRWGGESGKVALTKVDPVVVVEVSADAAQQAGQWRHPFRMVRIRAEMQPEDVATLPDPAVDA